MDDSLTCNNSKSVMATDALQARVSTSREVDTTGDHRGLTTDTPVRQRVGSSRPSTVPEPSRRERGYISYHKTASGSYDRQILLHAQRSMANRIGECWSVFSWCGTTWYGGTDITDKRLGSKEGTALYTMRPWNGTLGKKFDPMVMVRSPYYFSS